ncbi:MAG TPA: hypoxanthine-guanine phosphoribosyltransferase [Gammaproteobacteria bacterium]|nr:hypoxanthine-guanine phosphoribosyltransferase [Gammaproteobacteria bacterium]
MNAAAAEAAEVRRHARRLLSAAEVAAALGRMAEEIRLRLAHADPVVVAAMHGGVFTAVELCKHFDFPYQFSYVHAGRYGSGFAGGSLEWQAAPPPWLAGRHVLLVDDILDGGLTLAALECSLRTAGAREVHKAVLIIKDLEPPQERPSVAFAGAHIPDVFVFGCGMDYKGYWRGLPELWAIAHAPETGGT